MPKKPHAPSKPTRRATQQPASTPKYVGVRARPERQGFLANVGGYSLGQFPTAELAAMAYDRVARHLGYGPERLNFPERSLEPASVEQMRQERLALSKTRTTSRFRGVSAPAKNPRFRAVIKHGDRMIFLGAFEDEETAARHYDAAALKLKGKAAKLNFPGEPPIPIEIPEPHQKTSKYNGVQSTPSGRWLARCLDAKLEIVGLGHWTKERDAAIAHDRAALFLGLKRKLNFPRLKLEPTSPEDIRAEARAEFKKNTTSQYRGVYLSPNGTWLVRLVAEHLEYVVGTFDDEEEAAEAYDVAALYLHGDKAVVNFPADVARNRRRKPSLSEPFVKRRYNSKPRGRGRPKGAR